MRIQYISDLHLTNQIPKIVTNAEVIAILGDVGDPFDRIYSEFLYRMSNQFKLVLLVAGNHEFYTHTIPKTIAQLRKVVSHFHNVVFLNNEAIIYEGVVFAGTTLWSNILDEDAHGINDFKKIRNFGVEDFRELHYESVNFIKDILQRPFEQVVILTHHAPHRAFNGNYTTHLSAFSTDLNQFIQDPVKAWLCGHTHVNLEITVNWVKLGSNCLGYSFEKTFFDPGKYIEI